MKTQHRKKKVNKILKKEKKKTQLKKQEEPVLGVVKEQIVETFGNRAWFLPTHNEESAQEGIWG